MKNAIRRGFRCGLAALLCLLPVSRAFAQDATTPIPVDKFQNWKLTGPAADASRLDLSNEKKDGVTPLVIHYKFKPDQNDYVFAEQSVPLPHPPTKIRMSVYGDNSGASLRANFTDSSEEYFQAFLAKVDWEGWKDIEVPLTFPVHWGGDNNGKMDGPVAFHSIVINSEKGQTAWEGDIRLAKLEVISGSGAAGQSAAAAQGRSGSVAIDDFERANPLAVYQTWRGDLSEIDLISSSEFKKAGNYSMQMTYRLNTTRSEPSWASASFTPDRPLDWRGVQRLTLWVKGDGTRNYFQISFVDGANRVWLYQDNKVLRNVDWSPVDVSLADFNTPGGTPDMVPDLSKIQKWEFMIIGERPETSSGKVWLDEFTAEGPGLDPALVAPRAALTQEAIEKVKINFGDLLHLEYRETPELNKEYLYYNALYVRSSAKNLTLSADLVSQQRDAGQSVPFYRASTDQPGKVNTDPAVEPRENRPPIELAYVNTTIQNIHPNIASLSFGNLYVDYGRDVFSPLFGFKGAQADGNIQDVNYNVFAIKHIFDSFTAGGRLQTNYKGTLLRAMYVDHHDNAQQLGNAQIDENSGTLSVSQNQDINTQAVMADKVVYLDADHSFWEDRLDLTAVYGFDHFDAYAAKDITDPTNPKISRAAFDPIHQNGSMMQAVGRVKDWPVPGLTLIATGRKFDRDYKPRFRADPISYDSDITDVRGYSLDFTQILGQFKVNYFWDDVKRGPTDTDYYRRMFRQTYGYYGWNKFDLVFSITMRRELYALPSNPRGSFTIVADNPRDEDDIYYELYLGHWFSDNFFIWAKFITDNTRAVEQKQDFRKDFFQLQSEWSIFKNAKLTASIIQTRFDQSTFAPFASSGSANNTTGSQTFERNIEDNEVRVYLDVNF